MKLSIITPYYNCLEYTKELARKLEPQLTEEVEWIIIDDGCHEKELDDLNAVVIHLQNNCGYPGRQRNYGLDVAKGEYITFIDADDLIADDFIEQILNKINTSDFNYCLISWENTNKTLYVNVEDGRPEWNCSVWGIIYKSENVKNIRFNNKRFGEDFDFNQQALYGKEEKIKKTLYFYRNNENGICANWKE